MRSFPASDRRRLQRAAADPLALGLAAATGGAAILLGEGALIVVGSAAAVVITRLAGEYLVPRDVRLRQADEINGQEARVREALAKLGDSSRGRVPAEVEAAIGRVSRSLLDIVDRESGMAAGSRELFSVLGTATDYLPEAVEAYCRLPREYAQSRRLEGDRTATEILLGQLALLESEMGEVADAVSRNDLDRLLTHGRFLADRFGRSELDFRRAGG
ncbi:MAG: hypothetical protein NVS9B1_21720 [Candidatus Dormibacteraceae bacterium]